MSVYSFIAEFLQKYHWEMVENLAVARELDVDVLG